MKKLIFLIIIFLAACTPRPATVLKTDYLKMFFNSTATGADGMLTQAQLDAVKNRMGTLGVPLGSGTSGVHMFNNTPAPQAQTREGRRGVIYDHPTSATNRAGR